MKLPSNHKVKDTDQSCKEDFLFLGGLPTEGNHPEEPRRQTSSQFWEFFFKGNPGIYSQGTKKTKSTFSVLFLPTEISSSKFRTERGYFLFLSLSLLARTILGKLKRSRLSWKKNLFCGNLEHFKSECVWHRFEIPGKNAENNAQSAKCLRKASVTQAVWQVPLVPPVPFPEQIPTLCNNGCDPSQFCHKYICPSNTLANCFLGTWDLCPCPKESCTCLPAIEAKCLG